MWLLVHSLYIDEPYHFHDSDEESVDCLDGMFPFGEWFVSVGGFGF